MQSPQFVDYHQNRKIINKGAKNILASKSAPSRNSALRSYEPSICRFPYVARLQQTRKYRIKTSNHNNRRKFSDKIETITVSPHEHAEEWYLPAGLLFCRSMNMKIQREKVAFFTSFVFRRLCRLLDSPAFNMAHCSSDSSYDTFPKPIFYSLYPKYVSNEYREGWNEKLRIKQRNR